jgi:hypothetical protein
LARSLSAIASEASMPRTAIPHSASGRATRPVPMPSSRAGSRPANSLRKETVSSGYPGVPSHSSYTSAIRSPYVAGS